ncbi:MAG: phosphoribosylformylglycinamidine synthase subunit PurS [Bacteroidia bacterium]|nr:phosphoribosylformylglycinamidine synthase subunit PurS [Bacteroidia bacterium]MCZ2277993.1 phosphoribosylformylglycinamidine synthase subunit PurS [Bacteroidia bacterium]
MKFIAHINVMPMKALLDPQGKAVTATMKNLNLTEIENVRIGKHITLEIEASDKTAAEEKVKTACERILANLVMETFEFTVKEI